MIFTRCLFTGVAVIVWFAGTTQSQITEVMPVFTETDFGSAKKWFPAVADFTGFKAETYYPVNPRVEQIDTSFPGNDTIRIPHGKKCMVYKPYTTSTQFGIQPYNRTEAVVTDMTYWMNGKIHFLWRTNKGKKYTVGFKNSGFDGKPPAYELIGTGKWEQAVIPITLQQWPGLQINTHHNLFIVHNIGIPSEPTGKISQLFLDEIYLFRGTPVNYNLLQTVQTEHRKFLTDRIFPLSDRFSLLDPLGRILPQKTGSNGLYIRIIPESGPSVAVSSARFALGDR